MKLRYRLYLYLYLLYVVSVLYFTGWLGTFNIYLIKNFNLNLQILGILFSIVIFIELITVLGPLYKFIKVYNSNKKDVKVLGNNLNYLSNIHASEEIGIKKKLKKFLSTFYEKIKYVGTVIYLVYYLDRPYKFYNIKIIKNEELKNEIFKLRYQLYCKTYKLLDKNNYPDKIEKDKFDKYSEHFAVFSSNFMVGTFRIIKDSKLGFPTEKEFKLQLNNRNREKIIEISRVMVKPNFRKTMLFIDMLKTIYLYAKKNNYEFFLGCGEGWFIKNLRKLFNGTVKIIGKGHFCFNAINYPFIIEVKEIEKFLMKNKYILFYYFNYPAGYISI